MDGGGERGSTKKEAEAEYHCHDFEWEDLRADVEANPSFSYHLSPFPTTTASPQPPSSEAWRSFHRRHASGKFFKKIFTLSAIPFNTISATLERCVSVLKPGGLVLFRDYGVYDMTMLRFLPHQRVGFREYMRADGTYSYFFSLDTVRELFHAAGLLELELEYCCIRSVNRKNGKNMQRVWVHGKFKKPTS